MIDIFTYFDYRKFLKAIQEYKKVEDPSFSHRQLAREIGFDSGYFSLIIQNKRHISLKMAEKFAKYFQLDKKQTDYFKTLVLFEKAKTHKNKSLLYEKLLTFKTSRVAVLSQNQYELFEQWYYVAIRETIACFQFTGDFEDLGKKLVPPISKAKAKKAVSALLRLNLIKKDEDGVYRRIEPVWTTNRDIESVTVNALQMTMLDMAKDAFDRFPRSKRDMSTLTLSISHEDYKTMVEELASLRRKFLDIARNCTSPDRVYHVNLTAFPLSKMAKEGEI